jgi:hypothetical protein
VVRPAHTAAKAAKTDTAIATVQAQVEVVVRVVVLQSRNGESVVTG